MLATRLASYWNRSIVAVLLMLAGAAIPLGAQHLQEDAVLDTGENGTFEFCGGREFILKVHPAFEPRIHIYCRYPSNFVVEQRRQYPWLAATGTRIMRIDAWGASRHPEAAINRYIMEGGTVSSIKRDDWNTHNWLDNFSQPYDQNSKLQILFRPTTSLTMEPWNRNSDDDSQAKHPSQTGSF